MKKIIMASLLALTAVGLVGCDRVEPGNVGIKVNKLGDDKGVGDVVHAFTVGLENGCNFGRINLVRDPDVVADGGAIAHLEVESVFIRFHLLESREDINLGIPAGPVAPDSDDFTDTDLRQKIADALNRLASRMSTDKFIDGGKAELLENALKEIQSDMGPVGIQVISLSYVGRPEYPPTVIESINAKVTANQKTLQREQEVKQREAEANMLRAEADGQADAKLKLAEAEAKSIQIRGQAMRENPEVLQLEAINKWNGTLPQYMTSGTNTPFIQVK